MLLLFLRNPSLSRSNRRYLETLSFPSFSPNIDDIGRQYTSSTILYPPPSFLLYFSSWRMPCLRLPLIIASNPAASSLPGKNFEKERNSSALFAREISLVTQPSFDYEQGINSQVQTVCSNADAVFPVLGIVFCKNERFSLSRETHVPLWTAPRISHVRSP